MRALRITAFAFAASIQIALLIGTGPASAGQWDWLSNKDYVNCLKLFASGDFLVPANATAAQRDALHEKGRRYCNRQYYGHD